MTLTLVVLGFSFAFLVVLCVVAWGLERNPSIERFGNRLLGGEDE